MRLFCLCGVIAFLLLGGTVGCGGSGGTGEADPDPDPSPTPLTTLRGEYRIVMLSATAGLTPDTDPFASVGVGTATSNGRGELILTTELYTTDLPYIEPRPGPDTETVRYVESASRALTLHVPRGDEDVPLATGVVSADGEVAVLAISYEGSNPGLLILTRSVTSATIDSFHGKYLSLTWAVSDDATSRGAAIGAATLETPSTSLDTIVHENTDGVAWSGSASLTGSWDWDAEGGFDVYYSGSVYDFEGGLSCSDPVITCGGSLTAGDGPGIRTYVVNGSSSRSNADFAGNHYAAGLIWRPSDGHYVGFWGSLSSDGAGNLDRSLRTNDEGSIGLAAPITSTYELSTAGFLTVNLGSYGRCIGGLSETGHLAFLGGGINPDDPVSLVVVMPR